ncbi:MAG: hypothetical protein IKL48_06810 [Elusimicrobiaceae bacterium]|nr:hypothetical protein [Elusimicrobiaceae bacterium]
MKKIVVFLLLSVSVSAGAFSLEEKLANLERNFIPQIQTEEKLVEFKTEPFVNLDGVVKDKQVRKQILSKLAEKHAHAVAVFNIGTMYDLSVTSTELRNEHFLSYYFHVSYPSHRSAATNYYYQVDLYRRGETYELRDVKLLHQKTTSVGSTQSIFKYGKAIMKEERDLFKKLQEQLDESYPFGNASKTFLQPLLQLHSLHQIQLIDSIELLDFVAPKELTEGVMHIANVKIILDNGQSPIYQFALQHAGVTKSGVHTFSAPILRKIQ